MHREDSPIAAASTFNVISDINFREGGSGY
jgi:hypothetical protein